MAHTGSSEPTGTSCPGCGGRDVITVQEAAGGPWLRRGELAARLAKGPRKGRDAVLHSVEGLVLVALTLAWARMGADQGKPLYVGGGLALAVLLLVGTAVVVRGDIRQQAAERAGAPRAAALWRPARYCRACAEVFCPGGTPWRGLLTPEQFKKLVWTEAGYADQLPPDDAAREVEVPPGTVGEP
ncbi:hypothetical protein ABZ626_11970 [Streptomyces longispororuber]|uniref:hypothetical protein n=1 Tax=Streptomyces longispororuber TaxID=68230 RepID=UPI0033CCD05F